MQCTARLLGLLFATGWATAGVTGCTVGAPPGFSGGDQWTFPLVGPLEDGLLITPVTVGGHGPYLFAFDPDANFSAIDKQVVDDAQLRTSGGPKIIDETDTGQIRLYAELIGLKVSGLTIARRDVMLFPVGFYDTEGRHISGILGRDLIADSLVFGFDRDQGVATLSTTKAFTPPPDAIAISYKEMSGGSDTVAGTAGGGTLVARGGGGRGGAVDPGANVPSRVNNAERTGVGSATVAPVPRRLANIQIGDASLAMHLDLGAAVSQMPEGRWAQARLVPTDVELRIVDEAASVRRVTKAGIGDVAKPVAVPHVTFAPFIESRFGKETFDGTLGLDFFRRYSVYASWDLRTFYLKARGDAAATTTARLGRWSSMIKPCPHPGCVTAALAAASGPPTLEVARDAESGGQPLEVVLGVAPAAGKVAVPLLIELPRGVDKLSNALPTEYEGATLAVLDVSPFARACVGEGGCVLPLDDSLSHGIVPPPAAPAPGAAPADAPPVATAPAAPAAPRSIPLDKLKRLSGEPAIPPGPDARKAAGGKPFAVAIVKVCLTSDGKVDSTKIVKSSGVAIYDEQLVATIKASWTFAPDAKPEPLCTSATFAAR
jgi:TonB family protein